MANLNLKQLQDLARQAGWNENNIPIIAAIAIYESNGNPTAQNNGIWYQGKFTNEKSVGLLQINLKAHTQYTISECQNPLRNFEIGLKIYKMQGFNAWKVSYNKALQNYKGIYAQSKAIYSGNNVNNTVSISPVITANQIKEIANGLPSKAEHKNITDTTKQGFTKNEYYAIGIGLFVLFVLSRG